MYKEIKKGVTRLTGSALQAWPVGAVYISVLPTTPASLFGGTWTSMAAGKMLVGVDPGDASFDTVEETGGSKTKVLAGGNVPSHTHPAGGLTTQNAGGHNHNMDRSAAVGSGGMVARGTSVSVVKNATPTDAEPNHTHPIVGSTDPPNGTIGAAFDVMNPYITVYIWKRTA